MLPVEGLGNEWHDAGAASAKQDRVDRHTLGIFPFFGNDRALAGRRCEAGVGMRGHAGRCRCPWPPEPIGQLFRLFVRHSFPPHVAVGCHGAIGENGILRDGQHGIWIGFHARARCHTEETGFGIDGI